MVVAIKVTNAITETKALSLVWSGVIRSFVMFYRVHVQRWMPHHPANGSRSICEKLRKLAKKSIPLRHPIIAPSLTNYCSLFHNAMGSQNKSPQQAVDAHRIECGEVCETNDELEHQCQPKRHKYSLEDCGLPETQLWTIDWYTLYS